MSTIPIQPFQAYLRQQPDAIVAYLFGSVARHQATPLSDLDIAVLLDPQPDPEVCLTRQLTLLNDLDQLTEPEVQLTLLNNAPPLLLYEVVRDGILLHERRRGERIAFQVRALREYFDFQPALALHNEALRRRLQEGYLGRREAGDLRTLEATERLHRRFTKLTAG